MFACEAHSTRQWQDRVTRRNYLLSSHITCHARILSPPCLFIPSKTWFELNDLRRRCKGARIDRIIEVLRERLALIQRFGLPLLISLSGLLHYLVLVLLIVSVVLLLRIVITLKHLLLVELSYLLERHLVSGREVLVLIETLVKGVVVLLARVEIVWV